MIINFMRNYTKYNGMNRACAERKVFWNLPKFNLDIN